MQSSSGPTSPCHLCSWLHRGPAAGGVGLGQRFTIVVEAWETRSFSEAKVGRKNQHKAVHSNVIMRLPESPGTDGQLKGSSGHSAWSHRDQQGEQGVEHGRRKPEAASVFPAAPGITWEACPLVLQHRVKWAAGLLRWYSTNRTEVGWHSWGLPQPMPLHPTHLRNALIGILSAGHVCILASSASPSVPKSGKERDCKSIVSLLRPGFL